MRRRVPGRARAGAAGAHRLREGVSAIFGAAERILEAQQRAIDDHPDHLFHSLDIDAGSIGARRLIERMVAAASADARQTQARSAP